MSEKKCHCFFGEITPIFYSSFKKNFFFLEFQNFLKPSKIHQSQHFNRQGKRLRIVPQVARLAQAFKPVLCMMEHLKQSYFTNGIRFSDLFGGGWGVCPSIVSLSHKLITRVGFTSPLSQIWFFLIRFCHFHIDQKQVSLQRRNRDWVICVVIKYSNWGGKKYQQNLDLIAKSSYSSSQAFSEQNYYPLNWYFVIDYFLTIWWDDESHFTEVMWVDLSTTAVAFNIYRTKLLVVNCSI